MDAPRRNVELKARDRDPEATLAAALGHGAVDQGVLRQKDTYFAAREGRLKLREEDDGATLIAYARADAATARTSAYHLVDVPDPAALAAALDASLGTVVVVEKRRRLLLWEDVRIHLDRVEGLGTWVELEAVAPAGSDLSDEHRKVAELRAALDMGDEDVVAQGYAALLLARGAATDRMVSLARRAMERAYAPYSNFHVGVALRDEAGALHFGANVENGAYPQGNCAEASAIGALVTAGGHRIEEAVVMGDTALIVPCGGCRQRLSEFADADTPIHLAGPEGVRKTVTLADLLPYAFDLEEAQK
ncbi:MAG TPA: cytidine deaminase [Baekduia sp.]|uniref:cytidine deaminase n=1 Tax=Baekduia sp. TaxID=2600305 RepID=UPI002D7654ED|nr:cytidine deaminase [Baekduia sp.]HET6507124.1 cytidine deaminase [Baekduia sp.]